MTKVNSMANRFYWYFSDEIKQISDLQAKPLFKKLLFTSLLDCLGKARFPNEGNKRIVELVDNYSNWTDRNRVSLVQLGIFLKRQSKHSKQLMEFVGSRISAMASGNIYRSSIDPFINELEEMLKEEVHLLRKFRYTNLFYQYRHTMIHEFRELGHPMEMSQDSSTCYYHSYIKHSDGAFDPNSCFWELVFPIEVFKKICEGCIENLKVYFVQNQVDPYESYNFEDLWVAGRV